MFLRKFTIPALLLLVLGFTAVSVTGCAPQPPIPYQQLQVQDSGEAAGFDVYLYIAVKKELPEGDVVGLLEWFRDVKFPEENKIKVFVWTNPQSALIGGMGDMIATLDVDRENEIDEIKTYVNPR